jgi:spore maturation protein CgeB
MRVLIVAFDAPGHMGPYLVSAARTLGLEYDFLDAGKADASHRLVRSFHWRLRGKRPAHLATFGAEVLSSCEASRPSMVLTTGRAPLERSHLEQIRSRGIKIINYSTDDPWNPAQRAEWFLSALPGYDAIFTPRQANFDDFRRCGVKEFHYLPFAYDPTVHCPWKDESNVAPTSDVIYVGGCDDARLPMITRLIDAGLNVALFGGYWNRHSKTSPYWRGNATQEEIRKASASAKISLCIVRRANRDGHVMRSFEAAAIGGCVLAEDTEDHRNIFGSEAVRYFRDVPEMVQQAKDLVANKDARHDLSIKLREWMAGHHNTYADRLLSMMQVMGIKASPHKDLTPQ